MDWALLILLPIFVSFAFLGLMVYTGVQADKRTKLRDNHSPTRANVEALERIYRENNKQDMSRFEEIWEQNQDLYDDDRYYN